MGEHLASIKHFYSTRPRLATAATMGAVTILYLFGLKMFFVPTALVCMALYLPFPKVFRSLFSRLVAGLLLFYGLMLVAMLGQLVLFPNSDFKVPAVMSALLVVGVVYAAARFKNQDKLVWINRSDIAGIIAILIFAIPCAVGVGLKSGVNGVTRFGSIQSTDGISHFAMQMDIGASGHLEYKRGPNYYPKGFHYDTTFIIDSLGLNFSKNSWSKNVILFALEYVVIGAGAVYMLFYLGKLIVDSIAPKSKQVSDLWLSLSIGPALAAFYLLPFTYEGFLNYMYVIAAFATGLIYLAAGYFANDPVGTGLKRLFLMAYLLLIFGVSMSWNLLVPLLIMIPLFALIADSHTIDSIRQASRRIFSAYGALVAFGLSVQFLPFYIQFKYATLGSQEWFNAAGSIRVFHIGVVLASLCTVIYVMASRQINERLRYFVGSVFLPYYLFLVGLLCVQYFMAGEIKYYSIKSSYIIEMLFVVLFAALLVRAFAGLNMGWIQSRMMPILGVFMACLLLLGISGNPLQSERFMFRRISGFGFPAYYDSDIRGVTSVAGGETFDQDVIVAHYDQNSGIISGDLLISNWASALKYELPEKVAEGRNCRNKLYGLVFYSEVNKEQQGAVRKMIKDCAQIAKKYDGQLKLVTDKNSVPYLQQTFGDSVKLIYE